MGKTIFIDIKDDTEKIQLYCNKKILTENSWEMLSLLDISDIIGIEGEDLNQFILELGNQLSHIEPDVMLTQQI